MKKSIKRLYLIEILLFMFILCYEFIFTRTYSSLICSYISLSFFVMISMSSILLCGFPKDKSYIKKNSIKTVIIGLLFILIVDYMIGFFVGFSKSPYAFTLKSILINTVPVIILYGCIEIIRYIIAKNSQYKKLPIIIFTILIILYHVVVRTNGYYFYDKERIFVFICAIVFPIIAKEIFCSYASFKIGITTSLVFRIPVELYHYLLPIVPNIGTYIGSVLIILLPYVIYLGLRRIVNYNNKTDLYVNKMWKYIFAIPIICFLIVIVILVSGIFKYRMIAIASGSMVPTYKRGDAVIYEKVSTSEVDVGDILTFVYDKRIITHRVVQKIEYNGIISFRTKGDANDNVDGYIVKEEDILGVVKYIVLDIGYPTVWLNDFFERR